MSDSTPMETEAWPCPHCLQPLEYEVSGEDRRPTDEEGYDLLLDLPAGWVCRNDGCPTRQAGYHPDEGAKQRVLMLHQAIEGQGPGTSHGG
jgi:hypothetical protein